MKAGGGKAAFRQTFLFAYDPQHCQKYDSIALKKFPYISKWFIYSSTQLPTTVSAFGKSTLENVSLWSILNGEHRADLVSGRASICAASSATGDNVSIDNGTLRLDTYRHRFFELGLVKRHWQSFCKWSPHKKTGEYPRMYLQIPLAAFLGEPDVAERLCRVLLEKNPQMLNWYLFNHSNPTTNQAIAPRVHMKSVSKNGGKVSLDDDQSIYQFVNSFSEDHAMEKENVYLYEVEGLVLDSSILEDPNVLMIEGSSCENAVVSYTDQQHPLTPSILHEPARIFLIRPQCVEEGRCVTLCYA